MNKWTGKFITFEGGEGSGKSTQTKLLSQFLKDNNISHLITREPGGTKAAESIRNLLVTGDIDRWQPEVESYLLSGARWDHWNFVILPALREGKWIICDRFIDSTIAYQGYGHNVSLEFLNQLQNLTIGDSVPDITFIFDMPVEDSLQRSRKRGDKEQRFESLDLSFHERVRKGFQTILKDNPKRCIGIDASLEIENIHEEIIKNVKKYMT